MSKIRLRGAKAAGRVALVDSEDRRLAASYSWSVIEPSRKGQRRMTYARTEILRDGRRVTLYMHQLIGGWPMTDHINHNGLDNRRSNLRPATPAQNAHNRRPHLGTSSKYKGVMWSPRRRRWSAVIKAGGRSRYLGFFTDEEAAALAYNAAALETYGAYAYLNPVDGEPGNRRP
jgi:AP2 domain